MPNRYVNTAWKQAKLETAIMEYLADHCHRKISASELANVFQVSQNTVRKVMLPYLKDQLVTVEQQAIDVFYRLKEDGL
jgi:DNA-binding transcriptional ArsR family regulator